MEMIELRIKNDNMCNIVQVAKIRYIYIYKNLLCDWVSDKKINNI